jgi:hypothetical protein
MKISRILWIAAAMLAVTSAAAQTNVRVRGTIAAIDGNVLTVKSRDGRDLKVQLAWDLQPGSTMTNANVGAIVQAAGKRELTLSYKGGTQRIFVPEDAALVRAVPGTRADLVLGEYVFIGAQAAADGALTAARVQVSKDGVRPPQ